MPFPEPGELEAAPANEAAGGARHSPDFRSINWFGERHAFTEPQAATVRLLWEGWQQGTPDVSDRVLLAAAGSASVRLGDVFSDNRAWGTLIVQGATRGVHRLSEPGSGESPETAE